MAISLIIPPKYLWNRLSLSKSRGGWLSEQVHSEMEEVRKKSGRRPLWRRIRVYALPDIKVITLIFLGLLLSIFISLILFLLDPPLLALGTPDRILTAYIAIWQVQAGIAAVALPILLFVIGLAKDDKQAAMRSHEVLIRETWVFPIIVFSFAGTLRIGIDFAFFRHEVVLLFDFIFVFLSTIVFALFAYLLALNLLFNPVRMKKKSMAVAKEKMEASLDDSIAIRIANSHLIAKLRELNVGYWPFTPERREAQEYLILQAPNLGVFTDIHLVRLEEFISELPWKVTPRSAVITGQDPAPEPHVTSPARWRDEHVWLLKKCGDPITKGHDGLIRLEKAAFDNLNSEELKGQLIHLIKVTPIDED